MFSIAAVSWYVPRLGSKFVAMGSDKKKVSAMNAVVPCRCTSACSLGTNARSIAPRRGVKTVSVIQGLRIPAAADQRSRRRMTARPMSTYAA